MRTCLSRLFWGFFLIFIDFKINEVDVLPDLVGFLLVFLGASRLTRFDPAFRAVTVTSIMLAVLSVAGLLSRAADSSPPLGIVSNLLDMVMFWFLLGGLIPVAQDVGREDLQPGLHRMRAIYLAIHLLGWVFSLTVNVRQDKEVVLVLGIIYLVVYGLILRMLWLLRAAADDGFPDDQEGALPT